jgi:hypothetical protein
LVELTQLRERFTEERSTDVPEPNRKDGLGQLERRDRSRNSLTNFGNHRLSIQRVHRSALARTLEWGYAAFEFKSKRAHFRLDALNASFKTAEALIYAIDFRFAPSDVGAAGAYLDGDHVEERQYFRFRFFAHEKLLERFCATKPVNGTRAS